MFIEILFKMLLFKGGVLIYAEHCIYRKTSRSTVTVILLRASVMDHAVHILLDSI